MPNIELLEGDIDHIRHQARALEEFMRDDKVELTRGRWNTLDQIQRILTTILTRVGD